MCGGGGSRSLPTQNVQAVSPPKRSDAEIQSEAAKERARLRKKRGRSSTILTSAQGVTEEAQTFKTALGG